MAEVVAFTGGRRCRICSEQIGHSRAQRLEAVEQFYAARPGLIDAERMACGTDNKLDKARQCQRCQDADEPSMVRYLGRANALRRGFGMWPVIPSDFPRG